MTGELDCRNGQAWANFFDPIALMGKRELLFFSDGVRKESSSLKTKVWKEGTPNLYGVGKGRIGGLIRGCGKPIRAAP